MLRVLLIAVAVYGMASAAAAQAPSKEIKPEFDWRMAQFYKCADGQIDRLKSSRDESSAIVTAILLACQSEQDGVIQIGAKLQEFDLKRPMTPLERYGFENEGYRLLRDMTTSRLVNTRAQ